MKDNQLSAYGIWEVTTEGDCEGKSVRNLGTHEGYLDEIAFALADKCYYSLRFRPVTKINLNTPTRTSVCVSLDINTGTWDMPGDKRAEYFRKFLHDRPCVVREGQYYASVVLEFGKTQEECDKMQKEIEINKALNKLTPAERKLLGY
jgi:hypothetical protein